MNNMISFWLAPITALFHPKVYRDAVRGSGGRGLLYLLYLSAVGVVLFMALMMGKVTPVTDGLVNWAQKNMPVVIWTPAGISLENGQTTAELNHPQYGLLLKIDLTKTEITDADMGAAFFFVTAQRVYIKRAPGKIEARDITGAGIRTRQQLPERVRVTGEIVGKLYQNIKGTMGVVIPLFLFFIFFLLMLIANLFYSLVGLILNSMRKQKLGYGAVFALTCFATTASFAWTWVQTLLPFAIPWPLALNILINLTYLFFVFRLTDYAGPEAA